CLLIHIVGGCSLFEDARQLLMSSPKRKRGRSQTDPHPGPLPSDGRGRTVRQSLLCKLKTPWRLGSSPPIFVQENSGNSRRSFNMNIANKLALILLSCLAAGCSTYNQRAGYGTASTTADREVISYPAPAAQGAGAAQLMSEADRALAEHVRQQINRYGDLATA